MVTPTAEPAGAPPAPARFVTPAQVQRWDRRYHLCLSGLEGQEPDSGEVRFGTPGNGNVLLATLRRSATDRWFARLATDEESVPGDVTLPTPTPWEAARQGARLWSYATGQPYGDGSVAFQPQGLVSRSDALRAELGQFLDDAQQAVQNAAARAWPTTYGRLPELHYLGGLFNALESWQQPESPVGTATGAFQVVERLEALQQAADAWCGSLAPDSDARQHLMYPLVDLADEFARLQQRIAVPVEEMDAERAAAPLEGEARQLAAPAAEAAPEPSHEEMVPASVATGGNACRSLSSRVGSARSRAWRSASPRRTRSCPR